MKKYLFFLIFATTLNLSAGEGFINTKIKQESRNAIENRSLVLYVKPTCPFCRKVLAVLEELRVEITIVDLTKCPSRTSELVAIGGKQQVPCLIIDGKALYESDAIISYLRKKYPI